MRALVLLTALGLWIGPASGEETKSPYHGELREAMDPDGRISLTVPKRWQDKELAEGQLLKIYALGGGGHDIQLERRRNEADIDRMRDQHLKHDSAAMAGSTVKKMSDPFFGYRIYAPNQKRVVLRAFASDGPDGLVLTITSRHANYDQLYAAKLAWIAGSLKVAGKPTGSSGGAAAGTSGTERVHDKEGLFSVIAPAGWKSAELQDDEALLIAPGGRTTGTRIVVKHWGGGTNASLVLTKVASEWKRSYGAAVLKRLPGKPPRLLVRGRQGDSVDYMIGIANGDEGYTLRLVVREGSYERVRTIADEMAKSLVFTDAKWSASQPPDLDLSRVHRKALTLHGAAENSGGMDDVAAEFDRFLKGWKRYGFGFDRKAPPIHVVLCGKDDFAELSSLYGEPPAAYNRMNRFVVALAPPGDDAQLAEWRGALAYAMAEATMHRDLKVAPPPWLRRGLATCMQAAGRHNSKPDGEMPALAGMLLQRIEPKMPEKLATVRGWNEGAYLIDDTSDKQAHAWGYVHFMLFGKGALPNAYKKWKKSLQKARRKLPKFDLKKYDQDAQDLQKHIVKRWGASK